MSNRTTYLAVGLAAALLARPAAAESLDLAYEVAWGHLPLAEASVSLSEAGGDYRIVSEGRTTGVLRLFFEWDGQAKTEGLAEDGLRLPLLHSQEGVVNGNERFARIDWRTGGAPLSEVSPPPDLEQVTPVPDGATLGTADPFTVLLRALDGLAASGRCDTRAKVWDGRRRYDVVVEHLGAEELAADRPWSYAGPAVKCLMRVERIGGFWREPGDWKKEDDSGERAVWAADLGDGRYLPVRAEIDTAFGPVIGRLVPEGAEEAVATE